mmetsp:Transcript_28153/g.41585  ORF Transcript_28153/g.41585 Transcript_28153/m.41585 type:complete len:236 (-) Transcript_28153:1032-1739(-)
MDFPYSNPYDEMAANHREKRQRVQLDDGSNGIHSEHEERRLFPKTPHPSFSKKMTQGDDDTNDIDDDTPETDGISEDNAKKRLFEDASCTNNQSVDLDPEDEEAVDDEPDWENLGENEPVVKEQIELFLKTREIRDEADSRFAVAMDECNASMEKAKEQILQAAADIHHFHQERLDNLEAEIKQRVVWNHQLRTQMTKELEDTRSKAQGLFSQLLMSVSQPLAFLNGSSQKNGKT